VNERTMRKSFTFLHPFSLAGIDETMEAGTYIVETLEEVIEGLSFGEADCRQRSLEIAAGRNFSASVNGPG
jgi:hypothetical protein